MESSTSSYATRAPSPRVRMLVDPWPWLGLAWLGLAWPGLALAWLGLAPALLLLVLRPRHARRHFTHTDDVPRPPSHPRVLGPPSLSSARGCPGGPQSRRHLTRRCRCSPAMPSSRCSRRRRSSRQRLSTRYSSAPPSPLPVGTHVAWPPHPSAGGMPSSLRVTVPRVRYLSFQVNAKLGLSDGILDTHSASL